MPKGRTGGQQGARRGGVMRGVWLSGNGRPGRGGRWVAAFAALILAALPVAPAAAQSFYRESPELAARAMRRELPPVDQRLPKNPLLLQVEEEIGRYGGTWRLGMIGKGDGLLPYRTIGYEPLVRWDAAWRRLMPNVAQSYQVNGNGTVFTFQLRPGLRWSDGAPFTAEDVRFWFEDVLMEGELGGEPPHWMPRGRQGVQVRVDGEHTVVFRFDQPNALFLATLAGGQDFGSATDYPQHALKRLHRRYNPDADREALDLGFKSWEERFQLVARVNNSQSDAGSLLRKRNPDLSSVVAAEPVPTLNAWIIDRREPGDPARVVARRNPYYWKVDPAGNQLPYIDQVEFLEIANAQQLKGLLMRGVIGMQARHVTGQGIQDEIPAILERGGYRALTVLPSDSNTLPLAFNQTHPDPARRAILTSKDLRIALSVAINRRAIIDRVYNGQGEPYQMAPRPESRYFSAKLARQHLEHDPRRANALLDTLGFTARDGEGYRLDRSGERFRLTLLTRRDRPHQTEAMAMVARDWRQVGVEALVRPVDRQELRDLVASNRYEVALSSGDGGMDAVLEAYAYVPLLHESFFAPAWVRWVDDPGAAESEQPPASVMEQLALYGKLQESPDPELQARHVAAILDIAADQFFSIGISTQAPRTGVVPTDFRNVPRLMTESWLYPAPAPTNPSQYFIAPP